MAAQQPTVAVVGLKALNRDLKRLSDDQSGPLVEAMKKAGKAAAEPVASAARAAVPSDSGKLAGTIRTSGTKTGASVRMGTRKVSYAGWIEFGGTRTRPHVSNRPFTSVGRYLFPAAVSRAEEGAAIYEREVSAAIDKFNWTNTSTSAGSVHD